MLRHSDIWKAIDRLAGENGFSASGLARKAGLDPTTFNRSKRITREGKLRWPSTESIGKILAATGASLDQFVSYIADEPAGAASRHIPLIAMAQASAGGHFNETGHPVGRGWDEIPFPDVGDTHLYALEISGDGMAPAYRDGDIVVVSPQASIRRGDRVAVMTRDGHLFALQLRRRSARKVDLQSLNPLHGDRVLDIDDIAWIARIVWVSQ